jgi:hypothetical protein
MQRAIFKDLLTENRPGHLWFFFFFSVIFHVLMIKLIVEAPLGSGQPKPTLPPKQSMVRSIAPDTTVNPVANRTKKTVLQEAAQRKISAAEIRGVVRDENNRAVAGVEVRAVSIKTKPGTFFTTTTDVKGEYVLAEVPGGTYHIEVKAAPFKRETGRKIVLKAGEQVVMNVTFRPADSTVSSSSANALQISPGEYRQIYRNPYVLTFQETLADISIKVEGTPPPGMNRLMHQVRVQEILGACIALFLDLKYIFRHIASLFGRMFRGSDFFV